MGECRICGGATEVFFDLGLQPISGSYRRPDARDDEHLFPLRVSACQSCTMVQLDDEVARERMFREDYPYRTAGSARMRAHFEEVADRFLATELTGPDPFVVEIGCNDGVMLDRIARAGVRHLGVEPSAGVAGIARSKGVRVRTDFFEERTARAIASDEGRAEVVYAANTICHIPYLGSVLAGVDALLAPSGIFVFEDPYLGDIVDRCSFDQIYDEHFYYFTARSVRAMARRHGFELVDVERLAVHGGEVRYTLARPGARPATPAVTRLLGEEERRALADPATLQAFAARATRIRDDLVTLLADLRSRGDRVVAYGATAKSTTVANWCGLTSDHVAFVCDSTEAKQGLLTAGAHLPVVPPDRFRRPYPDYALLFAWNHAEEVMAKEEEFRASGGRWILYVPEVQVV